MREDIRFVCVGTCDVEHGIKSERGTDECCPDCGGELYAFGVIVCETCGEWADTEDAAAFRVAHACQPAARAEGGG